VIEPLRKLRRREQHQRDGGDEERGGECGRHRLAPTRLPGTPSSKANSGVRVGRSFFGLEVLFGGLATHEPAQAG
jgi:hypothetical protein